MRNTKKLIAVIMTIAIMASMMVPALAASYQTEAEKLMAVGLMKGTDNGADLEMALDRIQGITFTIRAMGVEEEALAMTEAEIAAALENVTDADTIPAWGRAYAAYAVANGITNGVSATEFVFAPFAKLSGTQFITMMLRALGYTGVTLDNCLEKAIAAGMLTAGKAVEFGTQDQLLRDGAAYIIYSTAKNGLVAEEDGVTPSDMTLIGKLVADGVITATDAATNFDYEAPAPAETTAITFTAVALNAIQFKLTFDQALNADDAVKESFYGIKAGSNEYKVGDAALQADGSVVLTVGDYQTIGNNTKVDLTLKKDIRNAAGVKLAKDFTVKEVMVYDTTFPTFDSVEAVGLKNLRLHYSEPVWAGSSAMTTTTSGVITSSLSDYFEVKNSTYTWSVTKARVDVLGEYIELTLGTNLIEGSVDVKTKNTVKDFANNLVAEKTISYTFVKDATAPVASIKSANQNEVVVKFNKPVYGWVRIAHSNKSTYYKDVFIAEDDAKDEVKAVFAGADVVGTSFPLPSGNVTVYVMAKTDEDVKDLYGNKLVETVLTATVTLDVTAPVVSSTEVDGKAAFKVTFDEKIDAGEAIKPANYTLKKADGTTVYFTATIADADGKVLKIAPSPAFDDHTDYVLTIKKVKDTAGNVNASDIVLTFKTGDNTNPTIKDDTFAVNSEGKIYIYFSEPMNATEMVKKANYLVSKTSGAAFAALGDDDTVSAISDKIVLIDMDLAAGTSLSYPAVQVSVNVTDLAGKKLSDTALAVTKAGIGVEVFAVDKAEAIATNKIKLTFTKEIASFNSANLALTGLPVNAVAATESVSGKEVVIVLTDAAKLATNGKFGGTTAVTIAAAGSDTKSVYGTVASGAAKTVSDKINPEVVKIASGDNKDKLYVSVTQVSPSAIAVGNIVAKGTEVYIRVQFTEVMDSATFSKLTYTVSGYTVKAVRSGSEPGSSDMTYALIVATADENNTTVTPNVTQAYNVKDTQGNTLASGSTYESLLYYWPAS